MSKENLGIIVTSKKDRYRVPALETGADDFFSADTEFDRFVNWASQQEGKIILLVNDDLRDAETLAESLVDGGATVHIISNPYEARDKIYELKPDILITDVEMPEKSGLTLVEETIKEFHE